MLLALLAAAGCVVVGGASAAAGGPGDPAAATLSNTAIPHDTRGQPLITGETSVLAQGSSFVFYVNNWGRFVHVDVLSVRRCGLSFGRCQCRCRCAGAGVGVGVRVYAVGCVRSVVTPAHLHLTAARLWVMNLH